MTETYVRKGDDITRQIIVGGAVDKAAMADLRRRGVTHILNVSSDDDDTELAAQHGIVVRWLPVDDDFEPKPREWFARGVKFAKRALLDRNAKLYVHCHAGIHRAPLATLAVLCSMGWNVEKAMRHIKARRPIVDFPAVYIESLERYLHVSPSISLQVAERGGALVKVGRSSPQNRSHSRDLALALRGDLIERGGGGRRAQDAVGPGSVLDGGGVPVGRRLLRLREDRGAGREDRRGRGGALAGRQRSHRRRPGRVHHLPRHPPEAGGGGAGAGEGRRAGLVRRSEGGAGVARDLEERKLDRGERVTRWSYSRPSDERGQRQLLFH